jgi:hypothetical protein
MHKVNFHLENNNPTFTWHYILSKTKYPETKTNNVKVFILAFMALKDTLGPKVVIAYVPPRYMDCLHILSYALKPYLCSLKLSPAFIFHRVHPYHLENDVICTMTSIKYHPLFKSLCQSGYLFCIFSFLIGG